MKLSSMLLLLGVLFCSPVLLFSQSAIQVTGTVNSEETSLPLSGVTVYTLGSKGGVVTDENGKFKLTVSPAATLVFSYIGYATLQEKVNARTVINANLALAGKNLEEVIIGYSSVKRKDLTGSVSSVSARQLKDNPLSNAAEALTGKLAGVQVTTSEGAPGACCGTHSWRGIYHAG